MAFLSLFVRRQLPQAVSHFVRNVKLVRPPCAGAPLRRLHGASRLRVGDKGPWVKSRGPEQQQYQLTDLDKADALMLRKSHETGEIRWCGGCVLAIILSVYIVVSATWRQSFRQSSLIFLGTGMMVDLLKHVGMANRASDRLNIIVNTGARFLSWFRNGLLATGIGVIAFVQSEVGREAGYAFFILGGVCVSFGGASYIGSLFTLRRMMLLSVPALLLQSATVCSVALFWLCAVSLYIGRLEVEIIHEGEEGEDEDECRECRERREHRGYRGSHDSRHQDSEDSEDKGPNK